MKEDKSSFELDESSSLSTSMSDDNDARKVIKPAVPTKRIGLKAPVITELWMSHPFLLSSHTYVSSHLFFAFVLFPSFCWAWDYLSLHLSSITSCRLFIYANLSLCFATMKTVMASHFQLTLLKSCNNWVSFERLLHVNFVMSCVLLNPLTYLLLFHFILVILLFEIELNLWLIRWWLLIIKHAVKAINFVAHFSAWVVPKSWLVVSLNMPVMAVIYLTHVSCCLGIMKF